MDRRSLQEMAAESQGLGCPKCGCLMVDVSYRVAIANGYRRVRACRNCGQRIQTTEQYDGLLPKTGR